MTNVSKQKLSNTHIKQLTKQLSDLFSSVGAKKAHSLFTDLCTESEQIMLVKRLAIIAMVDKEFSTYRIAKTLKVSDATVRTIRKHYYEGAFSHVTLTLKQKEFDREQFWETIGALLRLGMPPQGKDRWKSLK